MPKLRHSANHLWFIMCHLFYWHAECDYIVWHFAECDYVEWHHAKWHYASCRCTKCRGTLTEEIGDRLSMFPVLLNKVLLINLINCKVKRHYHLPDGSTRPGYDVFAIFFISVQGPRFEPSIIEL
jgi:hypothetical protein